MKREPRLTKKERRAARPIPENEVFKASFHGRELPVPYVAAWTSEMPNYIVRPEPLLGGKLALFRASGHRGEGDPIFGKMDVGRQRLCILRGICQVCGEPIEGPRWMALLVEHASLPNGQELPAVREPPTCTLCLRTSLRFCPGLRRARPFIVEPAKITTIMTLTTPPPGGCGPLDDTVEPLPPERLEDAVIGYLKIVVQRVHRRLTTDQFMALT